MAQVSALTDEERAELQRTGKVVIGLSLVLLVVLAIVEFLGRPSEPVGQVSASPT